MWQLRHSLVLLQISNYHAQGRSCLAFGVNEPNLLPSFTPDVQAQPADKVLSKVHHCLTRRSCKDYLRLSLLNWSNMRSIRSNELATR